MEELFDFGGVLILLTTGANKHECQRWDWWEKAEIVISVQPTGAKILKGHIPFSSDQGIVPQELP